MNATLDKICVAYLSFCAGLVIKRRQPCIVGVTGTVGKTTTKEVIAGMLTHVEAAPYVGSMRKTPENMNNHMGVALVVLGYDKYPMGIRWLWELPIVPFRALALATFYDFPKVLVLEYGVGWGWNLSEMVRFAPPTVAIVTTVGAGHLERFGTVKGVAQEKGHLVRATPANGLVVLGEENEYLAMMEAVARAPVVKVKGRGQELSFNVARAVGHFLGLPERIVTGGLEQFQAVDGRLKLRHVGSFTVIDDTFNANPLSIRLALDTLAETAKPGQRRIAILGGMAELGEETPQFHQQIGNQARAKADILIGVGELARLYEPQHWFTDSRTCAEGLTSLLRADDLILVKGSHSAHLDRLVRALRSVTPAMEAAPMSLLG